MNPRILCLMLWLVCGSALAQGVKGCDEAWADYNRFKERNVMEPSQYPLTIHGAAVRAACGPEALPVPPGTDTPHRPVIRKPHKPAPPPPPPYPQSPYKLPPVEQPRTPAPR